MAQPETWELIAIGAVVLLVLLWFRPGLKEAFKRSAEATEKDWGSVLLPLGLVILFVIVLVSLA
jgi:hypothetical protein